MHLGRACVYGVLCVDAASAAIAMSVLAYRMRELGGSVQTYGLLLNTFAVCNLLANGVLGCATDRCGARPVLVVSLGGVTAGLLATAWAPTVATLFSARAWLGFFCGVGGVTRAYLAQTTDEGDARTRALGTANGCIWFSYAAGAPLGALLARFDKSVPLLVGAAASAVSCLSVACVMPAHTAVTAVSAPLETRSAYDSSAPWTAFVLVCVAGLCVYFTEGFFMAVVPFFIHDAFGWEQAVYATLMTSYMVCAGSVSTWVLSRAVTRYGRETVGAATCTLIAGAYAYAACAAPSSPSAFLTTFAMWSVAMGAASGVIAPSLSELAGPKWQGRLMGAHAIVEVGGRVLGQSVLAWTYRAYGVARAFALVAGVGAVGGLSFLGYQKARVGGVLL